jgi:acetyl-CoA carboxylase biotin carboxyl carrier protein
MKLPWEEIEEITKYLKEKGLSEITIETKDGKITIKKDLQGVVKSSVLPSSGSSQKSSAEPETQKSKYHEVTSPMVGTFYMSATPGAEPFVKVGSNVKTGDVLCIIEAMKIMNELPSEVSGVIKEILAKDNQTVEYGQVLIRIEPL